MADALKLDTRKAAKMETHSPLASTPRARTKEEVQAAGMDPSFSPMVLCPLHNLGNTCYFNSGVQLMCSCPALLYTLRDSAFVDTDRNVSHRAHVLGYTAGQTSHTLFLSFAQLLAKMQYDVLGEGDSIRPSEQLDALAQVNPMFEGRSQQDCAEFLSTVLATIEDEARLSIQLEVLLESFASAAGARKKDLDSAGTPPTTATGDGENCFTPPEGTSMTNGALMMGAGLRSAHSFAVLQLMREVNLANEALERAVAQRKKAVYNNTFQAPRIFYNSVSDSFKGYTLSTISCHGCKGISRVVEPFTSLMLDLPTGHQRSEFARRHPEVHRLGPDGQPLVRKKSPSTFVWWNPLTYFTTLFHKLSQLCGGSTGCPLTLQECLDIHFESATLSGSNRYKCDACGQTCDATKKETLLDLPEYLVLQMKRFKAGTCFNSKKTDPVIFPVSWSPLTPEEASGSARRAAPEVLDLYPYVDPYVTPYVSPLPARFHEQLRGPVARARGHHSVPAQQAVPNPVCSGNAPDDNVASPSYSGHDAATLPTPPAASLTSTYTLEGVVVHHGSYGGGHYTVYARKLDRGKERWVYLSDDSLEPVEVSEVADAEEYMLLYRKQPLVQPAPVELELRDLARYYLRRASKAAADKSSTDNTSGAVYISRMWLHRMALLTDPGPIVNGLCYCSAREKERVTSHFNLFPQTTKVPQTVPHVHGPPAEWYYVPISEEDYKAFHDACGGSGAVSAETLRAIKDDQNRFVSLVAEKKRR